MAMSATLDAAKFVNYFPSSKAAYLQVWCLHMTATCILPSTKTRLPPCEPGVSGMQVRVCAGQYFYIL